MAYAVLVSLFNSTHKMLSPYPLIIPCNRVTIQSLHQNIDSLISFLDNTPPHKYQTTKSLEANIRDVGYKAEDILESYISKHSRSIYKFNKDGEFVETDDRVDENDENLVIMLSESLVEVIKGFESLMEQMKQLIQTHVILATGLPVNQISSLFVAADPSRLASTSTSDNNTLSANNKFVMLDEDFMNQIKKQLFFGDPTKLKIIPLVGMGGIGKTTLAKALIDDPFTSSHFDLRGWVTVSQQYSIQDVVENLLKDIKVDLKRKMNNNQVANLNIAEYDAPKHHIESRQQLHQTLYGRRYVVVLDDLWDTKACDELLRLFPDWNNGSRIIVTTRQSRVGAFAAKSYHEMKLLNGDTSWDLLRQVVFGTKEGNNSCPHELIEIGREIAKKCKGLPLTISVIGGLLSKEKITTQQHWEQVAENLKSVLTEESDECLEILSLSFNHLPHHLKACFLYLGIYPEDYMFDVSAVLELWIAEGFLKACSSTNYMEKVAEENLKELIQRNLILVERVHDYNGKPKTLKIHDLVRDLCIREAGKEKFLYVLKQQTGLNIVEEARGHRRLSILRSFTNRELDLMIQSMPGIHSLSFFDYISTNELSNTFGCELLRVIYKPYNRVLEMEGELRNLRYLATRNTVNVNSMIFKMWDLQYLILSNIHQRYLLPQCIWYMPQLRLVRADIRLPPLPPKTESRPICVLERLESLYAIEDFRCDDEVLVRIPNLRELEITYEDRDKALDDWSYYGLDNLVKMTKLETLNCGFWNNISTETSLLANLAFPLSLKNLSLYGCKISWEHMDTIIGVLPNLEVLQLSHSAFVGQTWETSENHFEKLEYLSIFLCESLQEWIVEDANHFPSLRYLNFAWCPKLEEIPTCIGEIPTLETIELYECNEGVVSSAKNIQDEINDELKLIIDDKTRRAYAEDEEGL